MDWVSEFNHAQNLGRVTELLDFEPDPEKRDALHQAFLREEDRVEQSHERLGRLDDVIRRGRERIRLQRTVVEDLDDADPDRASAAALLHELERTQALLMAHRARIAYQLGGISPQSAPSGSA
jgi:hypothetical protein